MANFILALFCLGIMAIVISVSCVPYGFYRPVVTCLSVFIVLTVLNVCLSLLLAHITRPASIAGTYTIEKTAPEMDKDGTTGNISCIVRDKDGKKIVLTTHNTLTSYKTLKIKYTTTFINAWNKDQYGNEWEKAN